MAQKYSSANTSMNKNKIPVLFTKVKKHFGWKQWETNLDIGGGSYDNVTKWLDAIDTVNWIYDPYNRPKEWNEQVFIRLLMEEGSHTATLSNVLNVIENKENRLEILNFAYKYLKPDGICYITCYNSGKKGISKKDCYQVAEPLSFYLKEVLEVFEHAEIKYGMIVAYK